MKNHRYLSTLLLFSLMIFTSGAEEQGEKLVILHSNDLHSRLDGFAPSGEYTPGSINDDNTIGGFSRIASLIDKERLDYPDNLIVLDDGDFLMGTIYHYMEEYNGFQLPLMKKMGYDLVALGNHEFDFGPGKLAQILESSVESGTIPGLLLSNVEFSSEDDSDNGLEELFEREVINRTTILERSGIKIGVFSLMGVDASDVAPFAEPVKFINQIRTARRTVKTLKNNGADIIICLSHSGVELDKKGRWKGEDVKLARKVKDLDVIISGHTHSKLNKALEVKNTFIVQTGSYGMNLGRLELFVNSEGVDLVDYSLIPVDDSIEGDEDIQSLIDKQKETISEKLFQPLGYDLSEILLSSDFELRCDEYGGNLENSNLGPLVADAIHKYINSSSTEGTDLTMVATGVIRDRIPPGILSVQDIFRVMSLGAGDDGIPGYPLATVYLTGIELKRVIEILLVSSKSSPSNYCYYSGIEAEMDYDKGFLRKIQSLSLIDDSGEKVPVDLSKKGDKLYSVSANAYMLKFIGVIKKTTFGLVKVLPKYADGTPIDDMTKTIIDFDDSRDGIQEGKEWIALVEYLKGMEDINDDGISDMNGFYLKPPLRLIPKSK